MRGYQQGNYGLAQDLREIRLRAMELSRLVDQLSAEIERWKILKNFGNPREIILLSD